MDKNLAVVCIPEFQLKIRQYLLKLFAEYLLRYVSLMESSQRKQIVWIQYVEISDQQSPKLYMAGAGEQHFSVQSVGRCQPGRSLTGALEQPGRRWSRCQKADNLSVFPCIDQALAL